MAVKDRVEKGILPWSKKNGYTTSKLNNFIQSFCHAKSNALILSPVYLSNPLVHNHMASELFASHFVSQCRLKVVVLITYVDKNRTMINVQLN